MKKPLIPFVLLLCTTSVFASDSFPTFNAEYKLYKAGFTAATAKFHLEKNNDGQYIYARKAKPAGIVSLLRADVISEVSHWQFDNKNLIKVNDYTFKHMKGKKRKKYKKVQFDWKTLKATSEFKDKKAVLALKPGVLDQLTLQLAVMRDLKNKRKKLEYPIIDDDELKTYLFTREGTEQVKTPAGVFKTIKIKRMRRKKNRVTYMWCSPDLYYLPVKIQHVEKDGSKHSLVLTKVKGLKPQLSTSGAQQTQSH